MTVEELKAEAAKRGWYVEHDDDCITFRVRDVLVCYHIGDDVYCQLHIGDDAKEQREAAEPGEVLALLDEYRSSPTTDTPTPHLDEIMRIAVRVTGKMIVFGLGFAVVGVASHDKDVWPLVGLLAGYTIGNPSWVSDLFEEGES